MEDLTKREYFVLEITKHLLNGHQQEMAKVAMVVNPEQANAAIERTVAFASAIAVMAADKLLAQLAQEPKNKS